MSRIFKIIFLLLLNGMVSQAIAQENKKVTKYINPPGLNKPTGYSHVTVTGGAVYISGQVAVNEKGEVVGKGDLKAQTIRVYENIKLCLEAAGVTFSDVVKLNTYVVNLKPEDVQVIREIRRIYLAAENPPASTLVGVTSLVNPDWLIEIEVVARIH